MPYFPHPEKIAIVEMDGKNFILGIDGKQIWQLALDARGWYWIKLDLPEREP